MVQGNSSQPIFEMILDSAGSVSGVVAAAPSQGTTDRDWHTGTQEGQLAVDVAETGDEIVVISTMAGADTGKIEVYVHGDLLTIRGRRSAPDIVSQVTTLFHQENFWGTFSRTVVLPRDVQAGRSYAEYRNGVLTVRIPKERIETRIPISIVEE